MGATLGSQLEALERDGEYEVVEVLKATKLTQTQVVRKNGAGSQGQGEQGQLAQRDIYQKHEQLFIRKIFEGESRQGNAYVRMWEEQKHCSLMSSAISATCAQAPANSQERNACLAHCPRILECYEYGTRRVVVLEYVQGQALEQYVKTHSLSLQELVHLFCEVCEAVPKFTLLLRNR